MKRLRIAWAHTHLHHPTGGSKYIIHLLGELAADHHVTALLEDAPAEVVEQLQERRVRVEILLGVSSQSPAYWATFPWQLQKLTQKLRGRADEFDFTITSMFPMHLAAARAGLHPLIVFCFEPFPWFYDQEMIRGLPAAARAYFFALRRFVEREDKRIHAQAAGIITYTPNVLSYIKGAYGRDATPISFGVDTNRYKPAASPKSPPIVLHSTDYSPLKNTADFIAAVPRIAAAVPDARFKITHTIERAEDIRRHRETLQRAQVLDRVDFLGRLSESELLRAYQSAGVGAYLGSGYGAAANSLFVLEMMACGKPIVRSDTSDSEVVHGETGLIYPVHDVERFSESVVQLLRDPALREKMGLEARRRIEGHFTWTRVKENLENYLRQLRPRS